MKKSLLILSIILVAFAAIVIIFYPAKSIQSCPPNDFAQSESSFTYLAKVHNSDPFFEKKICSIIDQSYTNFSIVLFAKAQDKSLVSSIMMYAKRKNKHFHIDTVYIDSLNPLFIALQQKIHQSSSSETFVCLCDNTTIANNSFTNLLDEEIKKDQDCTQMYTNYLHFPSLIKAKKTISFKNSPIKILRKDALLNLSLEEYIHLPTIEAIFDKAHNHLESKFIEASSYILKDTSS